MPDETVRKASTSTTADEETSLVTESGAPKRRSATKRNSAMKRATGADSGATAAEGSLTQDETARKATPKVKGPASRRWVPPVFITVGLLGVLWLMVYYIAGYQIPQMVKLGNWNIGIGMGLMALSFVIATLWK